MVNIVGLSSLNGRNDDDRRQDRDQPNQYYAGGASDRGGGSGLSVIGPGNGNDHVANIIGRAQQDARAAVVAGDSTQPRHVITFYREGFTVNDGPYRARSDPSNRLFLEALEQGHVPQELEGENRNEPVEISLVDKREENYVAPPPPAYTAFSGEGQTMGSSTYAAEAMIQGDAQVTERPVIDDKKPTTTLQIRLHNGQRLRETLNLDHSIRDLHAIIRLNDAGTQPYTLLAGFPPRPVSTDLDQTIEQAGLKGAAVTQKLIIVMTVAPPRRSSISTAKAFVGQIYIALQSSIRSTPTIDGIDCCRLWVQVGIVIATSEDRNQCTVDDGTGILQLELKIFLKNAPPGIDARPQLGDYIMAIGPMQKVKADIDVSIRTLLAHQVVKLDAKLQREPMWYLEVIEYWTSVVQKNPTTA
ncbi:hypothetical protein DD238_002718 [Peronospora effusa]|uniref:UBX domain-containing protein n=1 Tax=Peronospora effusa TaxID=542832 RepID=A0A3M6VLM0_9STRA|nr:hypothetical protein DD238_002718 [Peronospora effusa]RQM16854.1 hypothetical protein DD237_003429 [Peronospora effusa]